MRMNNSQHVGRWLDSLCINCKYNKDGNPTMVDCAKKGNTKVCYGTASCDLFKLNIITDDFTTVKQAPDLLAWVDIEEEKRWIKKAIDEKKRTGNEMVVIKRSGIYETWPKVVFDKYDSGFNVIFITSGED